ncbi:MAG: dTDP-glucose 4,6-dehydratase [Balneolales bacterium]
MRIIVTGGAGFIGSNLILHLRSNYSEYEILNVDKLTYASDLNYLKDLEQDSYYNFQQLDLVNREELHQVIRDFNPDGIFHLAAESHVDNSIAGPEPFVLSNIVGTFNILEEFRQLWIEKNKPDNLRFLHVSTDEVYGTLGEEGLFSESTPYAPNSPYSATKAGSDLLVRAYFHTYKMNVVTTNCSNNYGPHQHDEKLIPTVIRSAFNHKSIPVYGKGENIRDWLFVEDHCRALSLVFEKGRSGETYNIGGHNEWRNIDLIKEICEILNKIVGNGPDGDYKTLITYVKDRPGHDQRYAIDPAKIERELDWQNTQDFHRDLKKTVQWYLNKTKEKQG